LIRTVSAVRFFCAFARGCLFFRRGFSAYCADFRASGSGPAAAEQWAPAAVRRRQLLLWKKAPVNFTGAFDEDSGELIT
jgi:hypothetical protein